MGCAGGGVVDLIMEGARMRNATSYTVLLIMLTWLGSGAAMSQTEADSYLSPREARKAFAAPARQGILKSNEAPAPVAALPPYVLTDAARQQFPGTFGIDVSHWDFDKFDSRHPPAQCKSQAGYDDAFCSCKVDWSKIKASGVDFAYLKATDGTGTDLSFARNWQALKEEHEAGRIYRGAYHFLRFTDPADKQAAAFIAAVGATNGAKPPQLSPSLDMEPIPSGPIVPGSDLDQKCPQSRRAKDGQGRIVCDLWYAFTTAQVLQMAETWITAVEQATGVPVAIYTTQNWWKNAIGNAGDNTILKKRPIWIARYTDNNPDRGPSYFPAWGGSGKKWGMPPLPGAPTYPQDAYTDPHFWQWTEASRLTTPFPCNTSNGGDTDLNWVPLASDKYKAVFNKGPQ
jgi:GH25 family lysozyme M1 (1,4-beta-N-acetylmuramidase)